MNDRDLQEAYSFSDLGMTNHWKNLFEDRSERVATISDAWIKDYVSQDNYSELAHRLEAAGFEGWIPDLTDLHLMRLMHRVSPRIRATGSLSTTNLCQAPFGQPMDPLMM
jgi:hypothetical protein